MNHNFMLSDHAKELVWECEREISEAFRCFDAIEMITQERVLNAFREEKVSARHFAASNGYGYDDIGRDTLDRVYAHALQAEAALVRPQIVNGTHAIYLAVASNCPPGSKVLSVTGEPYDTLGEAFGIRGSRRDSLKAGGIDFVCLPMNGDLPDEGKALSILASDPAITMVYLQRSRGYSWRSSISVRAMQKLAERIKSVRKDVILFADNCYGEFTSASEPTTVGIDLIAGSLIKNTGGGIAPCGGYIAGKSELVGHAAHRLTVPGLGGEVGSYEAGYRPFYQGLFMAPHTVNQCLKTAALFSAVFRKLGYDVLPGPLEERSDIIESIRFDSAAALKSFMQSIQESAPIDSFVTPEEWAMPGYDDQVIMAAGSFVQGATTELSADGPMREPFIAYMQGGLTYSHGRIAAMSAVDRLVR